MRYKVCGGTIDLPTHGDINCKYMCLYAYPFFNEKCAYTNAVFIYVCMYLRRLEFFDIFF